MSQQLLNSRIASFISAADYSASGINTLMILSNAADNQVTQATADTEAIGVLMNNPKSGEAAAVALGDTVKVYLSGSITRGDRVSSYTGGKVIALGSQHNVFGLALESGSDGDLIEVLVQKYYK